MREASIISGFLTGRWACLKLYQGKMNRFQHTVLFTVFDFQIKKGTMPIQSCNVYL